MKTTRRYLICIWWWECPGHIIMLSCIARLLNKQIILTSTLQGWSLKMKQQIFMCSCCCWRYLDRNVNCSETFRCFIQNLMIFFSGQTSLRPFLWHIYDILWPYLTQWYHDILCFELKFMMQLVAVFVGCWYRGSNCSGEREEGLIVTTLLRAAITDQSHLGFQEPPGKLGTILTTSSSPLQSTGSSSL